MGQLIFIIGKSGSGKSTSLRNLDENSTVIINTDQKALPFRNFKEKYNEEKNNYLKTSDITEVVNKIRECHKNPAIKTIVIDTVSRLGTDFIMSPAFRADLGFSKWSKLSGAIYDLINIINDRLRDDIIVYLIGHPDILVDEIGITSQRLSMPGKQLDKFMLESFSSIVLYTEIVKNHGKGNDYFFSTLNNNNTAKSPMGLFEEDLIPNDLKLVNEAVIDYYDL